MSLLSKRGKNKELEAKANHVEKQYLEEKAARQDAEATIMILKKQLMQCASKLNENENASRNSSSNNVTMIDEHSTLT